MKVRDVVRVLVDDGWVESRVSGSHRHFAHPVKPGLVTVAGAGSTDVPPGTLRSIYRQAGIDWKDRRP